MEKVFLTEKARIFAKLLNVHDLLYSAIESLGDIPTTGATAIRLAAVLDDLDKAESQLDSVNDSAWWKREEK